MNTRKPTFRRRPAAPEQMWLFRLIVPSDGGARTQFVFMRYLKSNLSGREDLAVRTMQDFFEEVLPRICRYAQNPSRGELWISFDPPQRRYFSYLASNGMLPEGAQVQAISYTQLLRLYGSLRDVERPLRFSFMRLESISGPPSRYGSLRARRPRPPKRPDSS